MTHTDYHKNIMKSESHFMIDIALTLLPTVEDAIEQIIIDGDWDKYVELITPYDKYLWECNHNYPQKTNPINILQNKKYSSWRETLLLPLWIRIKNKLPFETVLLLNNPVTQTIFSDGTIGEKYIDGGLAVVCDNLFLPVIVNEDKSGHFCKTSAKNVNGILKCFQDSNSQTIRMCTTDNNVTIGKDVDAEDLSSFNIIASIRKENGKSETYKELNPNIFEELEKTLINEVIKRGHVSYMCEKYSIKQKQNKKIRESIDKSGLYINL
jgi:hypothetical protein